MKSLLIALAVASSLLIAGGLYNSVNVSASSEIETAFNNWTMQNQKSYGTDSERAHRLGVFTTNFAAVKANNDFNTSATYKLGLNRFADLTNAEFKKQFLGMLPKKTVRNETYLSGVNAPDSVNWNDSGAVTGVKDQGQCGSCWAFSTTGSIEGLHYQSTQELLSFSEQQLVDCSASYGNMGCNGGLMDYGFKYAQTTGLTLESNYQYTAMDGTCQSSKITDTYKIGSFTDVPAGTAGLKAAVAQRPVSIAIDAGPIQLYFGGIFNNWACGDQLDHGVLATGYGTEGGKMFWNVKNSWGASWGESGFFRLARKESGEGICGCTQQASYPTA